MELFNKAVKRMTKKASIVVKETVKAEAKKTAISILPTVIGIGAVVAGFVVFKSSLARPVASAVSSVAPLIPAVTRTSIVTNNYFFDPAVQAELVSKIINQ